MSHQQLVLHFEHSTLFGCLSSTWKTMEQSGPGHQRRRVWERTYSDRDSSKYLHHERSHIIDVMKELFKGYKMQLVIVK